MELNPHILRHHHITLSVGGVQEDYDFHTKILGLKSVKKIALYDGSNPVYNFYYGNEAGEQSTLISCIPMRQSGRRARQGSNQIKTLALSISKVSLPFWHQHLIQNGLDVQLLKRFGEPLLHFLHPCGIEYELVGTDDDSRSPYSNGVAPTQYGIRGIHGITVSVRDIENCSEFMHYGWSGRLAKTDGNYHRYEVGNGGSGTIIDFLHEPNLAQGSWGYGEGCIQHCAFEVINLNVQTSIKTHLEGLGYTDVSERKDCGYFDSIYVRTPSGALFAATVNKPGGFMIDEVIEELGQTIRVPHNLQARAQEIKESLEPLIH